MEFIGSARMDLGVSHTTHPDDVWMVDEECPACRKESEAFRSPIVFFFSGKGKDDE